MPPTNRLLEARKTYAEITEASQALVENKAALEKAIGGAVESAASLRTEVTRLDDEVSRLRGELDEFAAAAANHHKMLRGASVKMIVLLAAGGFLGALLGSAAVEA